MIISQISVFLENKPGQLVKLISLLAENNVDIKAMSIAESDEYGILRMIVDEDAEKVKALLKENSWMAKANHVLKVVVPDKPGSLMKVLSTLADNQISLLYSYAFFERESGTAGIIMRVDDNQRAMELLEKAGILN